MTFVAAYCSPTESSIRNETAGHAVPAPIIIDKDFTNDVMWWHEAISLRNGISFLEFKSVVRVDMDASTDGWYGNLPGIGIYNFANDQYVTCTPPEHIRDLHIADLELLAHVVTAHVWWAEWSGAQVDGYTDSSASFY